MIRKVGMGILRMISLMGCASILVIFALTTGSAFMPGTKVGNYFAPSAEALAGTEKGRAAAAGGKTQTSQELAAHGNGSAPDGGIAPDAGVVASTPAGQGSGAPTEAQALPAQQAR
jgi:hypothetical protein